MHEPIKSRPKSVLFRPSISLHCDAYLLWLPVMPALLSDTDKFSLRQAYCGDLATHNVRMWEGPFYGLWNGALSTLFEDGDDYIFTVFLQLPFAKDQVDDSNDNNDSDSDSQPDTPPNSNDGGDLDVNSKESDDRATGSKHPKPAEKTRTTSRVPDFTLVYLKGKLDDAPEIDDDLSIIADEELMAEYYRGTAELQDSAILVLCEVKAFPKRFKAPPRERSKYAAKWIAAFEKKLTEARREVYQQACMLFAEHDQIEVALMACVGTRFSWATCEREMASEISDHAHRSFSGIMKSMYTAAPQQEDEVGHYLRPTQNLKPRYPHLRSTRNETSTNTTATIRRAQAAAVPEAITAPRNEVDARLSSSDEATESNADESTDDEEDTRPRTRSRSAAKKSMHFASSSSSRDPAEASGSAPSRSRSARAAPLERAPTPADPAEKIPQASTSVQPRTASEPVPSESGLSERAAGKQPARGTELHAGPESGEGGEAGSRQSGVDKLCWSPHLKWVSPAANPIKDELREAIRAWNVSREF
ncbi:hypothetical protein B0H21DRAFT_740785 [Amylocystis lapponica]|nr:hypothetical protein B0H21DRAFT_740785 [Amylocystis lapponica]